MKKRNLVLVSILGILALSSCGESAISNPTYVGETIKNIRTGARFDVTLVSTQTYYIDSDYTIIDTSKDDVVTTYTGSLVFSNKDGYEGVDRRYYSVDGDDLTYVQGENIYNNGGFVAFNYVDYYNVYQSDAYAYSDDYNLTPYGSSGLNNPFDYIESADFTSNEEGYSISIAKGVILFSSLVGSLEDIRSEITLTDSSFNFSENGLSTISMTTDPYKTTTSDYQNGNYELTYITVGYELEVSVSEIGTSDAKSMLSAEPNKPENDVLRSAFDNMNGKTMTIRRHLVPYIFGELQPQEECIDSYFDGTNVYQQIYDYQVTQGEVPTTFSYSDGLYWPSNYYVQYEGDDAYYALLYAATRDTTTDRFTASLNSSLAFTYIDLYPVFDISEDIFNLETDSEGNSYFTPTLDNLPYMASECFIPYIAAVQQVSDGYVSDTRIYLTSDNQYIDRIEVEYSHIGYTGLVILSFEDIGSTVIPFDSLNAIPR